MKRIKRKLNAPALLVWLSVEMTFDSKLAESGMILVNNNKNLIDYISNSPKALNEKLQRDI